MTTATLEAKTETEKKIMVTSFDGKYTAKVNEFDRILLGYNADSKTYTKTIDPNAGSFPLPGIDGILSSPVIIHNIKDMHFDGYLLKVDTKLNIEGEQMAHTLEYIVPDYFKRIDAALKRKAEGRLSFLEVIDAFFSGTLFR